MTTTDAVKLYGAAWSVYVRIVRLALEEKQVKYDLVEVDVFAETGVPQEHLTRHPFGRIPASSMASSTFTRQARLFAISTTRFPDANCNRQIREPAPR
ncbi:glutathione S-transferase N-terminal domain-containing protein [Paraburkholderia caledonica]|uniref:GST N-terminal domain-containing protein n=1 Tax=Paraburkholderia caledonica TaxID=134536 RepID=A0AB73IP74_9BURK|nr:hypothetical protein [Paraburkholderia caledonica]